MSNHMILSVFHWRLLGLIEFSRLMAMCSFKQAAREADVAAKSNDVEDKLNDVVK